MVRRRAFLNFFVNSIGKYKLIYKNVIFLNLYYTNKIYIFSSNTRLFFKRFKHKYFFFYKNYILSGWSKTYYYLKKITKIELSKLFFIVANLSFVSLPNLSFLYKFNSFILSNPSFITNNLSEIQTIVVILRNKTAAISLNSGYTGHIGDSIPFIIKILFYISGVFNVSIYKTVTQLKLIFLYLEKNITISKGHHIKFTIRTILSLSEKLKPFTFRKKLNSNKLLNKRCNLRSRKPIHSKVLFIKINYINSMVFLKLSIQLVVSHINKKILTLFCCSNGIFFYFISTSKDRLFKFSKLIQKNLHRRFILKKHLALISKIKRLRKVSLIPNSKTSIVSICRAVGCYAKIMRINTKDNLMLLKLPSSKTYLIPGWSVVAKGFIRKLYKKKLPDTHAGSYRLLGKKANSRGVAMNSIDHPHGGNSNSIKLHKTPWGLPTKKK